jgi:PKD repeat protein
MKYKYIVFILIILIILLPGVVQATTYNPNFLPKMTSNTAPAGNFTTARSEYSSTYAAYKAFDGDTTTGTGFWNSVSSPYQWVQIQTPTGHVAQNYTIWAYTALPSYRPQNWTFQGSNDNTTWDTLDTRDAIINWGTSNPQSFEFLNTNSYTYYRLNVTSVSPDTFYVIVYEIAAYEASNPPIPVVSFTTNVTSGEIPLSVNFNDTTTGTTSYWNVSFGDNTWYNSTLQPINIVHTYLNSGSYFVNWTATSGGGTGAANTTIIAYKPTLADFYASSVSGNVPFTTSLYDISTNITPGPATYYWDLGDGNTSTSRNLSHTWYSIGTYTIKHSANNGFSTSWSNKTDYIQVTGNPNPYATILFNRSIDTVNNQTPVMLSTVLRNVTINSTFVVGNITWDIGNVFVSDLRVNTSLSGISGLILSSSSINNNKGFAAFNVSKDSGFVSPDNTLIDFNVTYVNYTNPGTTKIFSYNLPIVNSLMLEMLHFLIFHIIITKQLL